MISALWLILIVPASTFLGILIAAFLHASADADSQMDNNVFYSTKTTNPTDTQF